MAIDFLISHAERAKLGIGDEKFLQATVTSHPTDGLIIRVESPAIHALFGKNSGGKTEKMELPGGIKEVWEWQPAITGISFIDAGEELFLDAGRLNFSFLRSTSLNKGVEFLFPGPYGDDEQRMVYQRLEEVAKLLFARFLRQSQREFIIYSLEKEIGG